jgi:hypothetical protein
MTVTIEQARRAKEEATRSLPTSLPIVGLGLTKRGENYVLKVNLSRHIAAARLPRLMGDVPIIYEVVGSIRPQR